MTHTDFKSLILTEIKLLILAIVVWNIITGWDDFIDGFLYDTLKLKKTIWTRLLIAIIIIIVGLTILYLSKVKAHAILGIDMSQI